MFHRNCMLPVPLSGRDVRLPTQGSTKKADCIDVNYHGALPKMPGMFVSTLLRENRDLRLPAFTWAPTIEARVNRGLAWELQAVLPQRLLGPA
jgi:hypothetical protein